MRRLVAATVAALTLYIYLAFMSAQVFNVLVYDESQLMPRDIEPKLVESIVKNTSSYGGARLIPVVISGPGLEDKARSLAALYPNTTSAWSILDEALRLYNEKVAEAVNNATSRFREGALEISNTTAKICGDLARLVEGYREAREKARLLILGTYGAAALGRAVDNKTQQFLEHFRRYVEKYDVDAAIRLAADEVYGNVSRYLANVTWRNWASQAAIDSVTEALLSTRLNRSAIELARVVDAVGVRQYVYLQLLNTTPPAVRPYLPYLVCGGDVDRAVEMFREDLIRNITRSLPPPTISSLPPAATLIYRDRYALALIKTSGDSPEVPPQLGVPVSTSLLLKSFTRVVTEDVSKIDRSTAAALFTVLLMVMGTLLTPVIIVATVGLTYLATLGFIYQIHEIQKTYYLTVYMAAPVIFAIGVDYMLLMASRYAEERAEGRDKTEALAVVRRYANRAIAASAAVVATSLGSFAISRLPFMQSIGIGYLITTAFVVLTVFLVFPAILAALGDFIFWPKKTVALHKGRSRLMERAVATALRRPLLVAAISALATLASFAYLVTTLKVTTNPVVAMPETQYKQALEIAVRYFPNATALSTTYLAMKSPPPPGLLDAVAHLPHFVNYTVEQSGGWYVVSIKLSVEDTSDELLKIYHELDKLRQVYGPFLIGGAAAWKNVIFSEIYVKFWNLQIYVIIGAVFVILSLLLRSFLIPLRLIATVLMSISWSLAAEVFLFQEALGEPTYWLVPVVLFSFLMAVGTDYDIFIITRIREELEGGLDEREAVRRAIVTTGPVITGAAMILAVAFSTLALSQILVLREVGFTIALAALIDAFLIRPLVVPALIVLAGKYNWWWITGYNIKPPAQTKTAPL
ncbi:MMPL family transporter [Pyrobaculum sp.]|uniref:MMPL family transporter n=1 Tax=Pyrobaculum sp. TaxID=2004705 RepID=UPI003D1521E6